MADSVHCDPLLPRKRTEKLVSHCIYLVAFRLSMALWVQITHCLQCQPSPAGHGPSLKLTVSEMKVTFAGTSSQHPITTSAQYLPTDSLLISGSFSLAVNWVRKTIPRDCFYSLFPGFFHLCLIA